MTSLGDKEVRRSLKQRIFDELLPFVAKPGRYIGNEFNMIRKNPADMDTRVALVFPDVYEVGMSYMGFPILYHILNQQPRVYAERAFAPWADMAAQMRSKGVPLFSLETFSPLADFDLVGFTLQYELHYTTIVDLIDLAGLPLLAAERHHGPLIIGGGPSVFNPEPVADFFDLFVIGDGEETILDLVTMVSRAKQENRSRQDLLYACAQIPGVYVPQFYQPHYSEMGAFAGLTPRSSGVPERIRARIVSALEQNHYPDRPLVPVITTTHDRVSLEIARGCSRGCRFCNAGMIYRPVRQRSVADLTAQAVANIEHTGYDEVSLVSLSTSDYENLEALMKELQAQLGHKMVNISFPSLRPEKFTAQVARFAKGVRKSGLTLAPEAGTQRLRDVINKTTSAEDLLRAVDLAFREGWRLVKLYFMIGQPSETDADLEGMVDLIKQVIAVGRRYHGVKINVSVSPFVPKAITPFQWVAQDAPEETQRKIEFIRSRIRDKSVKISWREADVAEIEGVLARGDRRLAPVILHAWRQGARLEGWSEHFNANHWLQGLTANGLSAAQFTGAWGLDAALPWDHLDKGVSKKFLRDEYQRALGQNVTHDCRDALCNRCGLMGQPVCQNILSREKEEPLPSAMPVEEPLETAPPVVNRPHEGTWVRLHYIRGEEMRWISHLDFIHVFERALRRANWPLVYSEGFNPHPRMSFAPPLPTGYTSRAEYIDLQLSEVNAGQLHASMTVQLPGGISIATIIPLPRKPRALGDAIDCAEYDISWPAQSWPEDLPARIDGLMAQTELFVVRQKAGEAPRRIDVRPFIKSINVQNDRLHVISHIDHGKTVRMDEIINLLFPHEIDRVRMARYERTAVWISREGVLHAPHEIVETN